MRTKFESFYLWNGWFRMTISTFIIDLLFLSLSYLKSDFLSFLTQNGPEDNEAPCRYVNAAPIQWNIWIYWRFLKSCSKFIQRPLQSKKTGLDIHRLVRFHGYFFPNFGGPPSGARISTKFSGIMNLFKFWKCDLPSNIYFMKKRSCQNAFLPFKLPSKFR